MLVEFAQKDTNTSSVENAGKRFGVGKTLMLQNAYLNERRKLHEAKRMFEKNSEIEKTLKAIVSDLCFVNTQLRDIKLALCVKDEKKPRAVQIVQGTLKFCAEVFLVALIFKYILGGSISHVL